jgi:dinuclear metal center YbgI/SA1388 family protein
MTLPRRDADPVRAALEAIAPLRWAEPWDNVGWLVEPPDPRPLRRALLTIDLTTAVMDEAVESDSDLIVAYHPPIFGGLKRLRTTDPQQRSLMRAVARGISVYSPHTAADAAPGGVNDWLAEAVGDIRAMEPLRPTEDDPRAGAGRLVQLVEPAALSTIVGRVKAHLALDHVRVASPAGDPEIARVAICPGAGGSLFEGHRGANLYLTGEMRHHDVLARVAADQCVILTDHTWCERGWLPRLAEALRAHVPALEVRVSTRDADPLAVV